MRPFNTLVPLCHLRSYVAVTERESGSALCHLVKFSHHIVQNAFDNMTHSSGSPRRAVNALVAVSNIEQSAFLFGPAECTSAQTTGGGDFASSRCLLCVRAVQQLCCCVNAICGSGKQVHCAAVLHLVFWPLLAAALWNLLARNASRACQARALTTIGPFVWLKGVWQSQKSPS